MSNMIEIIAIIISAVSLILTAANFILTRRHDRKQATLEAFNVLQEQALDKLNTYSAKQIKDLPFSNKDASYAEVSVCLARVEHFCVGVQQKIYDFKVMQELAGGYLLPLYGKLRPVIERKEQVRGKKYYNNFEAVAKRLEKAAKK